MPLVAPLPKSWLVHTVTYQEKDKGRDAFGNDKFKEGIEISSVRYDEQTSYARDNTQNTLNYTGVVFVDKINSVNVPDKFVENSKLIFKDKTLTISRVITCYHPETDIIRHWELEVI